MKNLLLTLTACLCVFSSISAEETCALESCPSVLCLPESICPSAGWCFPGYIAVKGELNIQTVDRIPLALLAEETVKGKVHMRNGAFMALAYGWMLPYSFRVELEAGTRYNRCKDLKILDSRYHLSGYVKSFDAMLNAYYDFPCICGMRPFIGGGVGYAYHKSKVYNEFTNKHTRKSGNRFAVQGIGGVLYDVCCGLQLGLEYRYFRYNQKRLHNQAVGVIMHCLY